VVLEIREGGHQRLAAGFASCLTVGLIAWL
jgi:hypothetical protein